jgi:hypothetical protein
MKTLKHWKAESFEISSYTFNLYKRINKTFYRTIGGECTYTYNELGYRGDSINKKGFKVMSIGCSNTEGVGVNDDESWPAQFTKLIPNGVNMNFGTGGQSNDFIARCLLTYYDIINPDLVLIMYTSSTRREIYTETGDIEPHNPPKCRGWLKDTEEGRDIFNKLICLQNDNDDFMNWYKNHLLIKYFLESKGCNYLWNGSFGPIEFKDNLRFDGDFFPLIDKGADGVHPGRITHKSYAENLYNYINSKFPDYLDKPISFSKKLI